MTSLQNLGDQLAFSLVKIEKETSIYFQKQDDSYFRIGLVSQVPLRCN